MCLAHCMVWFIWSSVQVMISPFYFPVDADSFNFVSLFFFRTLIGTNMICPGLCHIRRHHRVRNRKLLVHACGQMASQRASFAAVEGYPSTRSRGDWFEHARRVERNASLMKSQDVQSDGHRNIFFSLIFSPNPHSVIICVSISLFNITHE